MRTVDNALKLLDEKANNKKLLEVACGCAEFSIAASKYYKQVECIDIVDSRLKSEIYECHNIQFHKMDATSMEYKENTFDTIVMYNAVKHLEEILGLVLDECLRVLKKDGNIYFISSFSIDKPVLKTTIPHLLDSIGLSYNVKETPKFDCIILHKE